MNSALPPSARDEAPLRMQGVTVTYANGVRAVRGVSLQVREHQILALVGESGSGKSTLAMAALGLLDKKTTLDGEIIVAGTDMAHATERTKRALRGTYLGYVAQNPMRSFDPLMRVADSVAEAWAVKGQHPPRTTLTHGLERLGIDEAGRRSRQYPNQWSGGMLQRAAVAAAAGPSPKIVIADEPTSALDADRADSVLYSLRQIETAVLLISHDLALVGRFADWVGVMYAGRLVEYGRATDVLHHPRHPYTAALLAASPRPGHGLPRPLPGTPPLLDREITGCSFVPRCPHATVQCERAVLPRAAGVECLHPLPTVGIAPDAKPADLNEASGLAEGTLR